MTDREKLMNMIRISRACPGNRDPFGEHCEACHYFDSKECDVERLADHLIANGVTFATDNNVGNKWIPVSKRLPERMMQCVCQYVFGDDIEYPFYAVMWYFAYDIVPHFQNEGSMGLRVTHWMPLPEPPKEE